MRAGSIERTTCVVVGGGPAGIFLGYLLARAGVGVTILEKHPDFLRDFRGDTIHPSTMAVLEELGLLQEFLPIVDFRTDRLTASIEGKRVLGPTFSHLDTSCPFIGFVPQWDFLNLLAEHGRKFPAFDLRMDTAATDVLRSNGRVVGIRYESHGRSREIRSDLVVAADGRSSTLRDVTHRQVVARGIPIDVLWFRLDRPAEDAGHTLAWIENGRMLVTIPRRDHYQAAMVIRKGAFPEIKARGLDWFRQTVAAICPPLSAPARRLADWEEVKLLSVQINHLERWHQPGLLFIGDASHAMSPVGGVGINLAIQDAVAAANLLARPLLDGTLSESDLARVQRRREAATRKTQRLQAAIHANVFGRDGASGRPVSLAWYARIFLIAFAPLLRRLGGHWIGMGFQPEHVRSPVAAGQGR